MHRKRSRSVEPVLVLTMVLLIFMASSASAAFSRRSPKILKIEARANGSVYLKWRKMNSVTGYALYRSESISGPFRRIKTLKHAERVLYTDRGTAAGKSYYYCVKAWKKENGKKQWSGRSFPVGVSIPGEVEAVTAKSFFEAARNLTAAYTECQRNGPSPTIDKKGEGFGTCRLIVKANWKIHFERFGACAAIHRMVYAKEEPGDKAHYYLVQFPSEIVTKQAYEKLQRKKTVLLVEADRYFSEISEPKLPEKMN